jgi:pimeloyl-ACP methyl ester carboxylesterase
MEHWLVFLVCGFVFLLALRACLQYIAQSRPESFDFLAGRDALATRLIVIVHGLKGGGNVNDLIRLARSTFPNADILFLRYDGRWYSNADPYQIADVLEKELHRRFEEQAYEKILLVAHSAGAAIARKVFVWAHGQEQDRVGLGTHGKRPWVDHVERIVLLAGINRGWSIEPRPEKMSESRAFGYWILLRIARVCGIAEFVRAVYRGTAFVANTRIQWLRISRAEEVANGIRKFPQIIQLIGDRDEIVSREDQQDLIATRGAIFVTLNNTSHRDILRLDPGEVGTAMALRTNTVRCALLGEIDRLDRHEPSTGLADEDRRVTRLIYVMHGIRDHGAWTQTVREELESRIGLSGPATRVINMKYGYFPLLPFILYGDRQRNVRRFMDNITENTSRFPNANTIDYIGHSNGTYILASALLRYKSLSVRRVYFAGSVVPKHFPWTRLIDEKRVESVINIVTTSDWVVAIFPKLFEQIADWKKDFKCEGWLDIGAGGFRGFEAAGNASGAIQNIEFAVGRHDAGVDVSVPAKLHAIVDYVAESRTAGIVSVFKTASKQHSFLSFISNVSYVIWIVIGIVLTYLGMEIEKRYGPVGLLSYCAVLFGLLNSI